MITRDPALSFSVCLGANAAYRIAAQAAFSLASKRARVQPLGFALAADGETRQGDYS